VSTLARGVELLVLCSYFPFYALVIVNAMVSEVALITPTNWTAILTAVPNAAPPVTVNLAAIVAAVFEVLGCAKSATACMVCTFMLSPYATVAVTVNAAVVDANMSNELRSIVLAVDASVMRMPLVIATAVVIVTLVA